MPSAPPPLLPRLTISLELEENESLKLITIKIHLVIFERRFMWRMDAVQPIASPIGKSALTLKCFKFQI